ncbi:hypothetical protein JW859_13030 [bacterium]|nr:hypothetical protein [bacterium]
MITIQHRNCLVAQGFIRLAALGLLTLATVWLPRPGLAADEPEYEELVPVDESVGDELGGDEQDYLEWYLMDRVKEQRETAQPEFELDWGGELEYRFSELKSSGETAVSERDLGFNIWSELKTRTDWELHFGLNIRRATRPKTNWVAADDVFEDNWPFAEEYWVRKTWSLEGGEFVVQAGRFTYPFNIGQLLIDNDLLLRGGFIEYEGEIKGCGSLERIRLSALGTELLSAKSEMDAAQLVVARAALRWAAGADGRVDAAVSYLDFIHAESIQRAVLAEEWRIGGVAGGGETTNFTDAETGELVSDYQIADLWWRASFGEAADWPVQLEVELAKNLGASGDGAGCDSAYYAELACGRRGDPGDLQLSIDHAVIEADAALAAVNRGEYATNYEGTRLQVRYTLAKNLEIRSAYTWSTSLAAREPDFAFDNEEANIYLAISW